MHRQLKNTRDFAACARQFGEISESADSSINPCSAGNVLPTTTVFEPSGKENCRAASHSHCAPSNQTYYEHSFLAEKTSRYMEQFCLSVQSCEVAALFWGGILVLQRPRSFSKAPLKIRSVQTNLISRKITSTKKREVKKKKPWWKDRRFLGGGAVELFRRSAPASEALLNILHNIGRGARREQQNMRIHLQTLSSWLTVCG